MDAPRGLVLLRRYFFYGWLFRDVNVGTVWEREAALAHNRRQSRWLPTYIVRWFAIAVILLAVARVCEVALASPTLSAPFYLLAAVIVAFDALTIAIWALLQLGW